MTSSVMSTPVHADAGIIEKHAAKRASRWTDSLEARVLRALWAAEKDGAPAEDDDVPAGLTAQEARIALDLPVEKQYSVAPRLSAMKRKRWVRTTGRARDGFAAYCLTDEGKRQIGVTP